VPVPVLVLVLVLLYILVPHSTGTGASINACTRTVLVRAVLVLVLVVVPVDTAGYEMSVGAMETSSDQHLVAQGPLASSRPRPHSVPAQRRRPRHLPRQARQQQQQLGGPPTLSPALRRPQRPREPQQHPP
jgi:hypothetical protein